MTHENKITQKTSQMMMVQEKRTQDRPEMLQLSCHRNYLATG